MGPGEPAPVFVLWWAAAGAGASSTANSPLCVGASGLGCGTVGEFVGVNVVGASGLRRACLCCGNWCGGGGP